MLKKTVQYEDFDNNMVSEDLYFNLSKTEIVEMSASGVVDIMQGMIKPGAKNEDIVGMFKRFIGMAYGVRTNDGRRFRKDPVERDEFLASPAYDALFMELVTSPEETAIEFLLGVLPSDMRDEAKKAIASGAVAVDTATWSKPAATSITNVPLTIAPEKEVDDIPPAFRKKEVAAAPESEAILSIEQLQAEIYKRRQKAAPKPLSEMTDEELVVELQKRQAAK